MNWHQKPLQWPIKCRSVCSNGEYINKKEQWNEAIRDMEHCLERNELKGFCYLVKGLTKNKKQAEPIKGLMINGERVQQGEETESKYVISTMNYTQKIGNKEQSQKYLEILIQQKKKAIRNFGKSQKYITVFNKAIGQDGFDGKILAKSGMIRECESKDFRLDEFGKSSPASKGRKINTVKQKLGITISRDRQYQTNSSKPTPEQDHREDDCEQNQWQEKLDAANSQLIRWVQREQKHSYHFNLAIKAYKKIQKQEQGWRSQCIYRPLKGKRLRQKTN
ncbi:hypothetical protein OXYTRIMIC_195 [Oxytricha trifallax]|uniref:Uncharacterized protein n=1 Tax=Oxytricha trifallax TaxID=1172189 RepID=A0A073I077_9SPIT|nr:hypothetical protein OXYTRIMIC_195 [Oxytricha trifallax]